MSNRKSSKRVADHSPTKGAKTSARSAGPSRRATQPHRAKKKAKGAAAKPFDKYATYRRAVQSAEGDVEFFRDTYKDIRGKLPSTLREDFCGTFAICNEWVKMGPRYRAVGIDLDYEPIQYGLTNYVPTLTSDQQSRVQIQQENVLNPGLPHADVICAMNFSHFIFKQRAMMRSYFHNCYNTLNDGGIFVTDAFGGSLCQEANEDETKHRGFIYYWDQESFDPVTHHAVFHIHFKMKGEKAKRKKVFTYDWRMWTLPEIRELMIEVGFKKTHVYWEGTTSSGAGDGIFKPVEAGEECKAWIAYVIGEK